MSWRTVVISNRCKLDLKFGYMVIRGEEIRRISSILKAIGIEISEEGTDPLERLLDYMELIREFDRDKLFLLVNLRSYFPDEQVSLFLQTVLGHEYHVIMIDSQDHPRLPEERRVTVDKDLCEF